MKKSFSYRLITNTAFQVLLAIIAGILVGQYAPETGKKMEVLGTGFVKIIKVFIGPIIFLTIVPGIGAIGDLKKVGRMGLKALIYFEVITTFALALGIVVALVVQPGSIDRSALDTGDVSHYAQAAGEFTWAGFFLSNLTLQVLIIAIVTGVVVTYVKSREKIVDFLDNVSDYVFKALKYVMYLAPIGAFGGMAFAVAK
ncbi:MAG TPA: cation:dicarboxylase symporter family transporter, partial [Flavobacteriales bacterium]|nr:cation:dicarboxylase symporter family transporter [Flavobacteriales bacterium]